MPNPNSLKDKSDHLAMLSYFLSGKDDWYYHLREKIYI